jgi:hypothetical protein
VSVELSCEFHRWEMRGWALLQWSSEDRQKRLQGSRLVEPTGDAAARFTEVVEIRLLGVLRPLTPLVGWLLKRRAPGDLRRLKLLLEASAG